MKLIPAGSLASADPVMAVRWCLERSDVVMLKERQAQNIHILFVIVYEGTNLEDRFLVPIDQMMTYLSFRRPGNHLVLAKVIWTFSDGLRSKEYLHRFLSKIDYRLYERDLLDEERRGFNNYHFNMDIGCLPSAADFEVFVPRQHFPTEPSASVKRLVDFGFEYRSVDQCMFRRRLLSAPFRLALAACWAVITALFRAILVIILVLNGNRKINFSAIIHPWRNDIRDVATDTEEGNTWFFRRADGTRRSLFIWLLFPYLHLMLFVYIPLLIKAALKVTYWRALFLMVEGPVSFAVRIAKGILAFSGWWWMIVALCALFIILYAIRRKKGKPKAAKRKETSWEPTYDYDKLYKLLACRTGIAPTLESIPAERRTFRLKYLDLKAKVCRPFAAS